MEARIPIDENDKRRLILKLITRLRCVECGQLYGVEDFRLVHRWQDVWVLSIRCHHCEQLCYVLVFMSLDAEPGPVIDLTPDELEVVEQWPPITADDVLDVHEILCEFDGDLEALFTP